MALLSFAGSTAVKNLPAKDEGNVSLMPGSGRSSGEGHGNPLQYSCLENPKQEPGGLQSMDASLPDPSPLLVLVFLSSPYLSGTESHELPD